MQGESVSGALHLRSKQIAARYLIILEAKFYGSAHGKHEICRGDGGGRGRYTGGASLQPDSQVARNRGFRPGISVSGGYPVDGLERRSARLVLLGRIPELPVVGFSLCVPVVAGRQAAWDRPGVLRSSTGTPISALHAKDTFLALGRDEGLSGCADFRRHRGGATVLHHPTVARALVDHRVGNVFGVVRDRGPVGPAGVVPDLL